MSQEKILPKENLFELKLSNPKKLKQLDTVLTLDKLNLSFYKTFIADCINKKSFHNIKMLDQFDCSCK